jgi:hypothetical protein
VHICPCTPYEGIMRKVGFTHPLPWYRIEVNGQQYAPAALPLGEVPPLSTEQEAGLTTVPAVHGAN